MGTSAFRFLHGLLLALLAGLLGGCASTQVRTTGARLQDSLCAREAGQISVVAFWAPRWRADQKEPELREAAAQRGIQDFFAQAGCVSRAEVRRWPGEVAVDTVDDARLLELAGATLPAADRAVLIVVRELGPVLRLGLPGLVEGGTEVVLDLRLLQARTGESMGRVHSHWRNGGTMVIKGAGELAQDMSAALRAVLLYPNVYQ